MKIQKTKAEKRKNISKKISNPQHASFKKPKPNIQPYQFKKPWTPFFKIKKKMKLVSPTFCD
jgi:hypothetical protein